MSWQVRLEGRLGRLELDVDFAVDESPLVLVGPNGSGKTTLLRAIAGAPLGLRGRIEAAGHVLLDAEAGVSAPVHARRMGYVPQGYGLFPHLSVLMNVSFGLGRSEEAKERARAALQRFEAVELAGQYPDSLSGGERQRVALARALVIDPRGLLLDEPLAALDASNRRRMRRLLAEHIRDLGIPTIVTTHDARDARVLGGIVMVIESGRIVQRGPIDELSATPATDFVAEFVG